MGMQWIYYSRITWVPVTIPDRGNSRIFRLILLWHFSASKHLKVLFALAMNRWSEMKAPFSVGMIKWPPQLSAIRQALAGLGQPCLVVCLMWMMNGTHSASSINIEANGMILKRLFYHWVLMFSHFMACFLPGRSSLWQCQNQNLEGFGPGERFSEEKWLVQETVSMHPSCAWFIDGDNVSDFTSNQRLAGGWFAMCVTWKARV